MESPAWPDGHAALKGRSVEILLVSADPAVEADVRRRLQGTGDRLAVVASLRELLPAVPPVDLILLDCRQGGTIAAEVAVLRRKVDAQVVAIAVPTAADGGALLDAGVDDYLLREGAQDGLPVRLAVARRRVRGPGTAAPEGFTFETARSSIDRVLAGAGEGLILYDTALRYTAWPALAEVFTGKPAAEVIGRRMTDVFPDAETRGRPGILQRALAGETIDVPDYEYTNKKTGKPGWVSLRYGPLSGPDGSTAGVLCVMRDVTRYVEARERGRAAKKLLDDVARSAPMIIFAVNREGTMTFAGGAGLALVGLKADEMVGRNAIESKLIPRASENVARALAGEAFSDLIDLGDTAWEPWYWPESNDAGEIVGAFGVSFDVTTRFRAERDLRESERRYRQMVEMSPAPFLVLIEGFVAYLNQAAVRLLGAGAAADVIGRQAADWLAPQDVTRVLDSLRDLAEGAVRELAPYRVVRPNGEVRHLVSTVADVTFAGKRAVQIVARDMTEELHAAEQLRESEERYRQLVDVAPEAVAVYVNGTVAYLNPAARRFVGASAEEVIGQPAGTYVAGPVREWFGQKLQNLLLGEVVQLPLHTVTGPGGEERQLMSTASGILFGGRAAVQVVAHDMTGQIRAEGQLRESEERYRQLVEQSPQSITVIAGGRPLYANPAALRLAGVERVEDFPDGFGMLHPDDLRAFAAALAQLPEQGGIDLPLSRIVRPDGEVIYFEASAIRITYSGTEAIQFVSRDMTAQVHAEERLRESEERYRQLVDLSPDGIAIITADAVVYANPAALAIMGASHPEDMASRSLWSFLAPPSEERARSNMARLVSGMPISPSDEMEVRRLDGSMTTVETSAVPTSWAGQPAFQVVVRDVTARKQAEQERLEIERRIQAGHKLESLGLLAGGVAHDFNNLLGAILGNCQLAAIELENDPHVRVYLDEIEHVTRRAAALARQMLAYAGKGEVTMAPVDLSALVQETGALLAVSLPPATRVVYELTPDIPSVMGDQTQLGQVVMNLVVNAGEAIGPAAGAVTLRTNVVDVRSGTHPDENLPQGLYVCVEVIDTGAGMDDATAARVFDPFFTTKFTGRGLGLAAVRGIVRAHHGSISVESKPGKGSRFRVLLPVSSEAA